MSSWWNLIRNRIENRQQTGWYHSLNSIAQLLKFMTVLSKNPLPLRGQEMPVPIYVCRHGHTRKKELVDRLHYLGLSISNDSVFVNSVIMIL